MKISQYLADVNKTTTARFSTDGAYFVFYLLFVFSIKVMMVTTYCFCIHYLIVDAEAVSRL